MIIRPAVPDAALGGVRHARVLVGLAEQVLAVDQCQGAPEEVLELQTIPIELTFLMFHCPLDYVVSTEPVGVDETLRQAAASPGTGNDELILVEVDEG